MSNPVLETLKLPVKENGVITPTVFDIPQGTVTEADLEEVEGLKADTIIRNASGAIASFDDGGDDLPLKSLVVNIEPKQSGSGDPSPSNVRPISGTDTVGIVVDGKNILSDEVQHLAIDGATGELLLNNARYALVVPYPKAGAKYTISRSAVGSSSYYYYGFYTELTAGQLPIDYHDMGTTTSYTVTAPEGAKYLVIFYGAALSPNPQVEVGEIATDYVPYNPNSDTKSITLPQTVFGGTLDVVKGEGGADRYLELDGTEYWVTAGGTDPATNYFLMRLGNLYSGLTNGAMCSHFTKNVINSSTTVQGFNVFDSTGGNEFRLGIRPDLSQYSTVNSFKEYLASQKANGTPVQLYYRLTSPTPFETTPTEVKSLLGDNNVWSDSGSVEVEYRADTSLVINKILEALA